LKTAWPRERAIEAVYHRHRLWPADKCAAQIIARRSCGPKRRSGAKVEDYLRQSRALELRAAAGDHG
jgi:hypothetical protein